MSRSDVQCLVLLLFRHLGCLTVLLTHCSLVCAFRRSVCILFLHLRHYYGGIHWASTGSQYNLPVFKILFCREQGCLSLHCIDYRGLNEIMVKNHYRLPLLSSVLDQLQRDRIFTKLSIKHQSSD